MYGAFTEAKATRHHRHHLMKVNMCDTWDWAAVLLKQAHGHLAFPCCYINLSQVTSSLGEAWRAEWDNMEKIWYRSQNPKICMHRSWTWGADLVIDAELIIATIPRLRPQNWLPSTGTSTRRWLHLEASLPETLHLVPQHCIWTPLLLRIGFLT